jgi:hypothetical protein
LVWTGFGLFFFLNSVCFLFFIYKNWTE